MKTELDHLPERQQRELARVRDILLEEFDKAIATATQPNRRQGKVYKIILLAATHATIGSTNPRMAISRTSIC